MIVQTLGTGDTAYLLRQALGRIRSNWSDFLADCIRGRASLAGQTLQPIARIKLPGDRCKRPRYTVVAVKAFILAVFRAGVPRPTVEERAPQLVEIEIDVETLVLPLPMRRAKRCARK